MYRRLLCAVVLVCAGWRPVLASDQENRPFPAENSAWRLTGKLTRNSVGDSRLAPYMVIDHWGMVRGEVRAANGVDLRPYYGHTVTLEGTVEPTAGRQPRFVAQRVLGDDLPSSRPVNRAPTSTSGQQPVRQAAFQDSLNSFPVSETVPTPPPDGPAPAANPASPLMPTPDAQSAPNSCCGPTGPPCPDDECGMGTCGPACVARKSRVACWVQVDGLVWWTKGDVHTPVSHPGHA